ncbi:histidine transporter [Fusobacterium necrophorum BFTR-1]|uniref:YjiH family protein n=1 Tax=Fusobacterium necrophorum TaxID=859 RepID=UPI0004616B88|nr:YjiH family protein [Fusobacterium necrophorum]KDE65141.1 histidine transporter [Fusobacterium necrophorum BFTR-1]
MSKDKNVAMSKFIFCSLFGIFMFFVPISIEGKSSIPLDHIVSWILKIPYYRETYGLILCFLGVILPFWKGTWNKSRVKMIFSIINIAALPFILMAVFHIGPEALLEKDMIPFIYSKIVVPVTTIVPVGSVFLAFIISYGLMEFVGVFMRPIMKPIFKTPGRSAIDAVASFVGSYSIALLITNGVYREGKYTSKEACIIATGFSTVSATFMIIVAKTLGFMENHWLAYFWTTVFVTFLVTAITARIYPLSQKSDMYFQGIQGNIEQDVPKNKWNIALQEAIRVSENAPTILENTKINLLEGFKLAFNMAPSLMAVGTLGLILAKYTPLFDIVGYIFYPFTLLIGISEPLLAAKALAMSIAEMFLPAVPVAEASMATKFIVGVSCVSEILFFSASIPCMLSTDIPLTMKDYFIIWFERVALSILITAPFAYLIFG